MAKKTNKKRAKARGNGSAKAAVIDAALPVAQTPAPATTPSHARAAPSVTDVSTRAHAIWIARGSPAPGTPLEDWLQAERELGAPKS